MIFCTACACILPCMAFLRLAPYSWPLDSLNALKRQISACGAVPPGIEPDAKHQHTGKRQEKACLKFKIFDCIVKNQGVNVRFFSSVPHRRSARHPGCSNDPGSAPASPDFPRLHIFLNLMFSRSCFTPPLVANNPGAMPGKSVTVLALICQLTIQQACRC